MKRIIYFLSITFILATFSITSADASVKAGASCKKLGETSTNAGKTYTCIKSKNKLVWNSGLVLPKTSATKASAMKIVVSKMDLMSLGTHEFGGVAMSNDGSIIIVSEMCTERENGKCIKLGYLYTSTDFGSTWSKQVSAGEGYWKGVAASGDGTKLYAVAYPGKIIQSQDYGVTWKNLTSTDRPWWTISTSANGQFVVAAQYDGSLATSINAGKTWTNSLSAGNKAWYLVKSSQSGSKLVAIEPYTTTPGGYLYTSVDAGKTWEANLSAGKKTWWSVDLSNDGNTLILAGEDSNILVSKDFGNSWNAISTLPNKAWNSVATSGDGNLFFAIGDHGRGLYFSGNSGETWEKWSSDINGHSNFIISRDGQIGVSLSVNQFASFYKFK